MRHTLLGLCGWTILTSGVGLVVSLIPGLVYTDPFWGVRAFVDRDLFATDNAPGILVVDVDSPSPVAAVGLKKGDRVLRVNGARVEMANFRELLSQIQPAQIVEIELKRDGHEMRLVSKGEIPKLEGVIFLDWQFVSAPVFLVLLIISIATQPLKAPLWRAILVTLGGLAVITFTVIVEATRWVSWTVVWRSQSVAHAFPDYLHYTLAAMVLLLSLGICILGALSIRAWLALRPEG